MHKIYALWCHPRSMSTATERIMRERGDLDCAHEPFMYEYYLNRHVREMPHFEPRQSQPVTYEGIRKMLLTRAARQPVFIKDMSYYAWDRIVEDADLSACLVNMFLIRDPVASLASYHALDADFTLEEAGLEAQWQHFSALRTAGDTPVVLTADQLRRDPRKTMGALWEAVGLPMIETAFEWQGSTPADWEQVENWHGTALKTRQIEPPSANEAQAKRQRFDAVAEVAPQLHDYLAHHQVFYELLKAEAVSV